MEYIKPKLKSIAQLATDIKSYVFESPNLKRHKAGQHYDVKLTAPDGYTAERKYSVLNAPNDDGVVELGVQILPDGEVSGYLGDIKVGDDAPIELKGPLGGYFNWSPQGANKLMLIGGGSGIVPLLSMLFEAQETGFKGNITLLYGARTIADAIYLERLNEIAGLPGYTIAVAFSRDTKENLTDLKSKLPNLIVSDARMGQELIEKTVAQGGVNLADFECYICGRTALVEDIATILLRLGVDFGQIKTERYG